MTVGSAAYLDVQWVEMVFNASPSITGGVFKPPAPSNSTCKTVCTIDGVKAVGFPQSRSNAISTEQRILSLSSIICLIAVVVAFA
jgi:hypothetical protein